MKIICQYTGLEFEAASRRSKNHPRVSDLLNEAAKGGWYRTAVERFAAARERGMADLDAILQFVRTGGMEAQQARQDELARRAQIDREIEHRCRDAKRERDEQNSVLREAGFRWRKFE